MSYTLYIRQFQNKNKFFYLVFDTVGDNVDLRGDVGERLQHGVGTVPLAPGDLDEEKMGVGYSFASLALWSLLGLGRTDIASILSNSQVFFTLY